MPQLTSPRLPGVPILQPDATGPIYSRWRRSIKFALETKGTWKYCNGKCPMPMPEAGPNSKSSKNSQASIQPSLLEERRAWVRHDREVKLDIFLSLADEVMQEVFEVGPPLPPSNLNAREMLKALDETFVDFKFGLYHHAFCHFLNLHIDQYATIEEFNEEFSTTLEDLLDHGQPLSNAQACSAYFSKLRCTQNPWVAKKLEEWDAQSSEPELVDLMKESPPWSFIRPLVTKSSQGFHAESIQEESLEDSSAHSDSDTISEPSDASTASSRTSRSRHTSSITTHSQEITVHASSEDVAEIDPLAFRKPERLPASAIPECHSSKDHLPKTSSVDDLTDDLEEAAKWRTLKKSAAPMPLLAPINRPLPPLPPQASQLIDTETRSRSTSPRANTIPKSSSQTSLTVPTLRASPPTSTLATQSPMLRLETTHPTLRPITPTSLGSTEYLPTDIHPALRPRTPTPTLAQLQLQTPPMKPRTPSPPLKLPDFVSSSPNLAIPWPSTPDIPQRPHSSRAALPFHQQQLHEPAQHNQHRQEKQTQHSDVSPQLSPLRHPQLNRADSTNSSVISLPLQGTRDSAWDYLYEKTSASVRPARDLSVSPIEDSESRVPRAAAAAAAAAAGSDITALPALKGTLSRAPTFDDFVIPSLSLPVQSRTSHAHDFVSRLSGDSGVEASGEVREREKERDREQAKKHRKKMSWSVNVNLARFSASKGVKEII
ncbi:Nn.00g021900.m01.CDS01 [Neocucurbitaria sp. VM-36]